MCTWLVTVVLARVGPSVLFQRKVYGLHCAARHEQQVRLRSSCLLMMGVGRGVVSCEVEDEEKEISDATL